MAIVCHPYPFAYGIGWVLQLDMSSRQRQLCFCACYLFRVIYNMHTCKNNKYQASFLSAREGYKATVDHALMQMNGLFFKYHITFCWMVGLSFRHAPNYGMKHTIQECRVPFANSTKHVHMSMFVDIRFFEYTWRSL